jgi:nitrogen PTS system EIIA component
MNLITKLLPPTMVVLDMEVGSKKRLFEQIGLVFENEKRIAMATVFESLFAREKLGSTGLGYGVAIPHGRIKGLRETCCAFIRTASGVPFDAPDGEPVRLIFSMLVPEHATEQHLQILSELAQMFSDPAFRDALLNAPDVATAHQLLVQWSPYGALNGTANAPPVRSAAV